MTQTQNLVNFFSWPWIRKLEQGPEISYWFLEIESLVTITPDEGF